MNVNISFKKIIDNPKVFNLNKFNIRYKFKILQHNRDILIKQFETKKSKCLDIYFNMLLISITNTSIYFLFYLLLYYVSFSSIY